MDKPKQPKQNKSSVNANPVSGSNGPKASVSSGTKANKREVNGKDSNTKARDDCNTKNTNIQSTINQNITANNNGNQNGKQIQQSQQRLDGGGKKYRKQRNKANRSEKKKNLSDPQVIIDRILEHSTFKVPNLSEKVEAKFLEDKHYKRVIGNIIYKSTINSTLNEISVFPHDFKGQVNIQPSATTSLECIYHKPDHGPRRRYGKKSQKRERKLQQQKIEQRKAELLKLKQQHQPQQQYQLMAITNGSDQDVPMESVEAGQPMEE